MILRPATVADRTGVVTLALHFHAANDYARLFTVDASHVGVRFDHALQQGAVFVAELDSHRGLVGFLALMLGQVMSGELMARDVAWWVEPAYRSGTTGPQLLRMGEEWARKAGCVFLEMSAPTGTSVGRFYELNGYTPIETAYLKRLVKEGEAG